jgi:hypothetical protein
MVDDPTQRPTRAELAKIGLAGLAAAAAIWALFGAIFFVAFR